MTHDLIIRGGTVHDGLGSEAVEADVAIDGDTIVEVGEVTGDAAMTVDATGRIVTPGFVDLHTHMDAQAAWDASISPCSHHGITSALIGNCSVTFAPCKPEDRSFLANMMETVEDIPADIILEGMPWDWESYGEYLDSMASCGPAINLIGLVGHAAVRFHVLGERAIAATKGDEPEVTDAELAQMVALTEASVRSGAIGISFNRLAAHVLPDGRPIPGTYASHREIVALSEAAERAGGITQVVPCILDDDDDRELMRAITQGAGARLLFSSVVEHAQRVGADVDALRATGSDITGITLPRRFGSLAGLRSHLPFRAAPWREFRRLDLDAKLALLADTERRDQFASAIDEEGEFNRRAERIRWLGDTEHPTYLRDETLADEAQAAGCRPIDLFLDRSLDSQGMAMFHQPFANHDLDQVAEHLDRDWILPGLGDAGAHARQICDAGYPTFYLSHWVRDLGAVELPRAVQLLSSAPAAVLGLSDRGTVAPGMRADLNVLDLDRMAERQPTIVSDMPKGGQRLVQGADGYDATVCNGVVISQHDQFTGDCGGRILRSGDRAN
ncbi:MAG: amidohydrolase family protein [Actinomycetota bacterium]|nr:amidohydrolase family protein [Actinomycetota bacterium]